MKSRIVYTLLVCGLAGLGACGTPDGFEDFDSAAWKKDSFACAGDRQKLVEDFEQVRKELYGKKEYVLRNVLGRPDSEELLERNQRIYYYYIEPGTQCSDRTALSAANRVEVRINALGKVSEVAYNHPYKTTRPE
ncbi:hypothetical protein ACXYMU_10935 [Pontibacter sp. CAU 1760]